MSKVETPITLWKQQNLSEVQLCDDRRTGEHLQAIGSTSPLTLSTGELSVGRPVSPASVAPSDHSNQQLPPATQRQQSSSSLISLPHLPAGSGRAAASRIRSSNQQSPHHLHSGAVPRLSTAPSDSHTVRSRDALTLMQRARRVARMVASADNRMRQQGANGKTATGGTE